LKPDVVRTRYFFGSNFIGDPSIYFRAKRLITEAVDPHELRKERRP